MSTIPPPPPSQIPPPPGAAPGQPTQPTRELQPSLAKGALYGVAAAVVGGLVWYLLVAGTKRQFVYGAAALGLLIGWAVVKGAQREGLPTALIATAIAALTVIVTYFYIDRYLIIKELEEAGQLIDISLFPSWTEFTDVLSAGFKAEKSQYLFGIISVLAAAILGFTGGQQKRQRQQTLNHPAPPPPPYRPDSNQ